WGGGREASRLRRPALVRLSTSASRVATPHPSLPHNGGGKSALARVDDESSVGPGVANVGPDIRFDLLRSHALPCDLRDHDAPQLTRYACKRRGRFLAQRLLDRLLAHAADVGEPHAIGGEER